MLDKESDQGVKPLDLIISKGISPKEAWELKEDLYESELATDILYNLHEKDENYTSQIARDLDKSQTSIDRLIRKMRKAGIISVSKEGRSVYYQNDIRGTARFVLNSIGYGYAKKQIQIGNNSEINLTEFNLFLLKTFLVKHMNTFFQETPLNSKENIQNKKEIQEGTQNKKLGKLIFDDFIYVFQSKLIKENFSDEKREKLLFDLVNMYMEAESSLFAHNSMKEFEENNFMGLDLNKDSKLEDFADKRDQELFDSNKAGLEDLKSKKPGED